MFAEIHLWEFGILLIGVAFVVGAIYAAKSLKNLSKTIEDVNGLIASNKQRIDEIVMDIESITKSSSGIMNDVEESVGSVKGSVRGVEKTVSSTKNYILKPVLKVLNLTHTSLKIIDSLSKKRKKSTLS